MKSVLFCLTMILAAINVSAQLVAKLEVKEEIPGICDKNEVYALLPMFDGQKEAKCSVSKDEILKKLNAEVTFFKDNPKYKDEGMMSLIINCKGEVVKCEMDNKTKNAELDKQIEAVFKTLAIWEAGTLNGKRVDSSLLYSFKIKKGKFVWS